MDIEKHKNVQTVCKELKEQLQKVRDMASGMDLNVEVLDEAIVLWDETIDTLNKKG